MPDLPGRADVAGEGVHPVPLPAPGLVRVLKSCEGPGLLGSGLALALLPLVVASALSGGALL